MKFSRIGRCMAFALKLNDIIQIGTDFCKVERITNISNLTEIACRVVDDESDYVHLTVPSHLFFKLYEEINS